MDAITVLLIAVGLAMDCLSVSIMSGLAMKNLRISNALRIGASFGFFQAFMPVMGWLGGLGMKGLITGVDHWVAFGLLSAIGGRMVLESIRRKPAKKEVYPLNSYVLLTLSVATSIDALAVGVSLAFLKTTIVIPVVVMGTITFLISSLGVYVGNRFGRFFGSKVEAAGGFILIGIGIKILIEHLC